MNSGFLYETSAEEIYVSRLNDLADIRMSYVGTMTYVGGFDLYVLENQWLERLNYTGDGSLRILRV